MGEYSVQENNVAGPNTITSSMTLSPSLAYYPGPWMSVGLLAEYSRLRSEFETPTADNTLSVSTNLGLTLTALANYSDQLFRPLPYLGGTFGLTMVSSEIGDLAASDNGHFFSVYCGTKLRLSESFMLNVQPTLQWFFLARSEPVLFGLRFGFSGLL